MPRRLLLALLTLVAAPLVLLGWVSANSLRNQRDASVRQLQGLLQSRLIEIDDSLARIFDGYVRRLAGELEPQRNLFDVLRELELSDPLVRKGILVSGQGVLVYPNKPVSDDPDAIALYAALDGMISSRPDAANADESGKDAASGPDTMKLNPRAARASQTTVTPSIGSTSDDDARSHRPHWQVWYMDEGSQLVLWVNRGEGQSVGILLERVRWIADMTTALPDSSARGNAPLSASDPRDGTWPSLPAPGMPALGFTALVDEAQQIVYRWGEEGQRRPVPLASIPLSHPLGSWHLEYHSDTALIPPTPSVSLFVSVAGIAIVLLALGGFVLTGVQRQMRTARNRVSFAGQVSHELRTPLTNIRLYAELAQSDLDTMPEGESRQSLGHRLAVIDSESRRLSRLTSGVLEMIRDDRKQPPPRISPQIPDEVIEQTIQQFSPRFAELGLEVDRDLSAARVVGLDRDLLEMILVNLLSNVEKYAADGKRVDIRSRLDGPQLTIVVQDYGAGIPRRKFRSVFRAFTRLDHSIQAPSGTGIGLTIARAAADRHGGQLQLIGSQQGSRFELVLPVTP
jgi:signal transduction histidine kinase